jgi:transcriptional regulator NrdR family protein
MRLGEVCQGINYQIIQGSMDTPITGVCYDSRKVEPGNLFVCVVGVIERELREHYDREVSSRTIGEMVMDHLQSLDEVAYVRFASVYRQFTDLNSFIKTIDQLKKS